MNACSVVAIKLTLMSLLTSCAASGDAASRAPMTVKMTPNHPSEPTRIRFDVTNASYPTQNSALSAYEQNRLGMHQLAKERLLASGWCPYGFMGPEFVLGKKMTTTWFFFVDCLPAPPARPQE